MSAPPSTTAPTPQLWTINDDGEMTFALHEGQARTFDSTARFVFMIAGTQSGKTSFGPLWLWNEINTRGPGDYLVVSPTIPLLRLKALPEFLNLFERQLRLGSYHGTDHTFYFADDSTRVIFGSATHPGSLESATAKAAWLDECGQDEFRIESWQAILRRLSIHRGRVLGTTTPFNLGWLKTEVYDRWKRGERDYDVIQFDSTLNPIFPRQEFEDARGRMAKWKFDMFYRGMLTRPEALIYGDILADQYREDGGHLVRRADVPLLSSWPHYGGLDFGGVNNARLLGAEDPVAKVLYIYSELLEGNKTTAEHARAALEATAGVNMEAWCGGAPGETQQRRDWTAAGVKVTEPPIADVESGIDAVLSLAKTRRLFICDDLAGTRDELGTYQRPTGPDGKPQEGIKDKQTFHRLDALRYLVLRYATPVKRVIAY